MIRTQQMRDAAAKRAQQVRQAADRPSRRRCAESLDSQARVVVPMREVRVSETLDDGTITFDGHASVTELGYEMWDWAGPYDEIVRAGAFTNTLARTDLDVPFVIGHDQIRRMARTTLGDLILTEDETGLRVQSVLSMSDPDVAYIVPKLRAGLIDEMSFAFRIVKGTWSPDWTQFYIDEVDLHRGDVAIVGYGANPYTAGSGLAGAESDDERSIETPRKRGVDLISEADIAPRRA